MMRISHPQSKLQHEGVGGARIRDRMTPAQRTNRRSAVQHIVRRSTHGQVVQGTSNEGRGEREGCSSPFNTFTVNI